MALSRDQFAGLIPHRGAMSLLHEVLRVDDESITCRAVSHRDSAHPLREDGILPAVSGIEYAAQAMAVHGALNGAGASRAGVLAAVRDVALHVERLDDIRDDLILTARRLLVDGGRLLYEFDVRAGERQLLSGRATVMLDAGEAG